MSDMDRHKETYLEEAYELLAELEESLLELEENPGDEGLIGRVFRALHTIKGSGSMFGFDDVAAFTHEVETVFEMVRAGEVPVTKELIDLTLAARDNIRTLLEATIEGDFVDEARSEEIVAGLKALLPAAPAAGAAPSGAEEAAPRRAEPSGRDITYRVVFKPSPDIFLKGANPVFLLDDLRHLGDCKVVAQTKAIPPLEEIDPERCYTYWDIVLTTDKGIDAIKDVFIFVEDESEVRVEAIDRGGETFGEADYMKIGEILVERGDITKEELQGVLSGKKRLGEALVDAGLVEEMQVESAYAEQQRVREARRERLAREAASTIRVSSAKLDTLVDLVGELVTLRAQLGQISDQRDDPEILGVSEAVERLTAELHDNAMGLRMVPIGSIFSKFRRLVRDLSSELGREVKMTTGGASTELDKTVIERLNDPLVHLIRNCIDHGIEPPLEREEAGKPRQGIVHLAAMQSGPDVLIMVFDDGRGLDPDRILSVAADKGIVPPDAALDEKEIFGLIFHPGFSTAGRITGVSGRGVGMDVVKRAIEALRGSIELESKKGKGTTITLRIPLTLAIIEGLLVVAGGGFYVVTLSNVEECVELSREDIKRAHGRHIVNVRDDVVPYIRLRERFSLNGEPPDMEQIVIVNVDGKKVGLVVDNVIGEHQTVIKSLGRFYRAVRGISGATILGDGTVALILDVPKIIETAELDERAEVGGA